MERARGRLAVAVVLASAGALFATSGGTAAGTDLRASEADLPALVRQAAARLDDRDAAVSTLRSQVEQLSTTVDGGAADALQAAAAQLSGPAQLQPVSGPALTVTLDDAPSDRPIPQGYGPNDVIVHQQDLQAVVNALWASGAEAMMLMDQRVISTSAVRCVGNTLNLQGRLYSPPYLITAIGDTEAMRAGLDASPQIDVYRDYARVLDLTYRVEESTKVEMPAYDGSITMRYARSADPAAGSVG